MQVIHNFFSQDQLDHLLALPAIQSAFIKGTNHKFSINIESDIQATLNSHLGLNLSASIPVRLIVGDTSAHIDQGPSNFEHTYLVYLNDAEGEFIIDGQSHPITANTAFKFAEGLSHEVKGSNGSKRLLLGPMNESGQPVGGSTGITISADGATSTIYISEVGGALKYRIDDNPPTPFGLLDFPITIQNTNPSSLSTILKVIFETDITLTTADQYFITGSEYIQFGSQSLNVGGTRPIININTALADYRGLIQNGVEFVNGYSYIFVFNLDVRSATTALVTGGGWIGQEYFGRGANYNEIINCSSNGIIDESCGGILGRYAGYLDSSDASDISRLSILGCTSSGNLEGDNAGGIVGAYSANKNNLGSVIFRITKCRADGDMVRNNCGGIAGAYFGLKSESSIIGCYSTGTLSGSVDSCGGIVASFSGTVVGGILTVRDCYSTGPNNGNASGGIFGSSVGTTGSTITIQTNNCYSIGAIGFLSGGIFGANIGSSVSAINMYTAGTLAGANGAFYAGNQNEIANSNHTNGWNTVTALTILSLIFFINPGGNQPFLIYGFGYTPYLLSIISAIPGTSLIKFNLVDNQVITRNQGQTIGPSLLPASPPYTYALLGNTNSDITINSSTGLITTSPSTSPGTYTFNVYASNNPYSTTNIFLTITGSVVPPTPTPTPSTSTTSSVCCGTLAGQSNLNYVSINDVSAGNAMLAQHNNPKASYASYTDYLKTKIARAYGRR
jgi:hypothetical protein